MIGTILRSIEESPKNSKRRNMPVQKKLARQTGEPKNGKLLLLK